MSYKTISNKVYFFFSDDAKIMNSSWISAKANMRRPRAKFGLWWSKSCALIGYPSRPDELILPVHLEYIRHFTRLDQSRASRNTFINLLEIV